MRRMGLMGFVAAAAFGGGAVPAAAVDTPLGTVPFATRTSVDCDRNELRLTLENRSARTADFTVTGTRRAARDVAPGASTTLRWAVPNGSRFALHVTAPDGHRTDHTGRASCGLRPGTPGMNTTRLFSTDTPFQEMLQDDGSERPGTARSVRIPALAVTNSGTLLAVADARVDGPSDLPADIQLGLRRSTDDGASWSAPRVVVHAERTTDGTGDSSLLVDRVTGRVFLFYNHARPGTGFFEPNAEHGRVLYVTSDDDGRTWSRPVDLTARVKKPGWTKLFASSGHGIQLHDGRLVQPLVHRDARSTYAENLVSDDHGRTWRTGAVAGRAVNESKPVQRSTGAVDQNMRHNDGGARYYATSPDGAGPFGPMRRAAALPDPRNNADEISLLRPRAGTPGLTRTVLFSNTPSTTRRDELTVRLSRDDGAHWPHRAVLKSGRAGYSTLAVLRDGSVGCLYEVGDTGGLFFARFTPEWVRRR